MRYIIYGAGAIGGVIGGRLSAEGHDVVLIARGAHLDAIRSDGLTVESARGTEVFRLPAVERPGEIDFGDGDIVLLAMKTQDTEAALLGLRAACGSLSLPIFCVQNGVENERLASRYFDAVYGVLVFMPAAHMEPGVVSAHLSGKTGILDLGRYPSGSDALAKAVADDLNGADLSVVVRDKIMPWKYAKLLGNLGNAAQAACGLDAEIGDIYRQLREEALACFAAAGIVHTPDDEFRGRREGVLVPGPNGPRRAGGSSWQSLARGAGSIETDFLNGEIALLGRLHGIATPANRALQRIAARLVHEDAKPGAMTPDQVQAEIDGGA